MTYIVSFNNIDYEIGGYEDNETTDYCGENISNIVKYVENMDDDCSLVFKLKNANNADEQLIGYFYEVDDDDNEYPIAVMYVGKPTLSIEIK